MLKPIENKTTVDIAIESIGNYIANNMQVGDVLPSERELAIKLQISRNITREALQHFRTLGIIESKPKVGAVVTSLYPCDAYAGYKPFLSVHPHTFDDLAHLRLTLELGCVSRAVKNVTLRDIEDLKCLCKKIYDLSEKSTPLSNEEENLLNETDILFHTKIMKLSNNALMNSLIPLVVEFFDKQFAQDKTLSSTRNAGYQEHFDMVKALEEKDPEKLSELISSHLDGYFSK